MGTLNTNLLWIIAGTFGALSIGSVARLFAVRNADVAVAKSRIGSLKVWWALALLLTLAVLFGKTGATILLAVASLLAMREFLRLVGPQQQIGTPALCGLAMCATVHYLLIAAGHNDVAKWFLPVVVIVLLGAIRAYTCRPEGYIRITAAVYWGTMLLVYAFSFSLFLFDVDARLSDNGSAKIEPTVGPAGWFLFLVLLTEMNDIMQAIVGRKFGKTKITPAVSPNKSLEGLAGGMLTSMALSLTLAPWLTTLTVGWGVMGGVVASMAAGILISITGFLGDINMSAIKRDAGVKDGSAILPGMGGIIDRIDSLTFTAPVFYYFVLLAKRIS